MSEAFLRALFGPYGDRPGLTVEVRSIQPLTHEVDQEWFGLTHLAQASEHCQRMAKTHDVYVGALPRSGRGAHARHIEAAAWMYADVDGGDGGPRAAADLIRRATVGPPDTAVMSGGGIHAYWALEPLQIGSEADRQRLTLALRRLVRAIGGEAPGPHADRAATDVARILRVPWTWNHKPPRDRRVMPLRCGRADRPRSIEDWEALLPALPVVGPGFARTPRIGADTTDEDLLGRACRAQNGSEFARLWIGDTSRYGGDDSRADAALMAHLSFWTGGDAARMERMFGQSQLGAREKWQERPDYRRRTIERMLTHGH